MAQPARSFALTDALIREHRSGALLCLDRAAIGQSFELHAEIPTGFELLAGRPRANMGEEDAEPASERVPELATSGTGVAVVRAFGVIAQRASAQPCGGCVDGYDALATRFCAAHEAPEAGAVLLVLDGPGGDVPGLDQGAYRMLAAAQASGKDTIVYIDERAASAHYMLAAVLGTGGIYMPRQGRVGSIGVMCKHTDRSGANAEAGEVVTYFSSPAGKVAGNPDEALSDLARARFQALVDDAAGLFVAAVASARGLAPEAIMALDGAMLTGQAAVDAGLADGLATFEEVVALAAARASAGASLAAPLTPAPAPAAPPKGPMAHLFSPAVLAFLPTLSASDSPAAVETALLGRLGALRDVMAAAGDANPATLAGTVKALALDAAKLPALLDVQKALDASQAAALVTSEAAERVALLEGAVRTGKLAPADAWAWDETGKIRSVAPDYGPKAGEVGMSLAGLRGFIERKAATTPASTAKVEAKELSAEEIATAASVASLSAQQLAFAQQAGVDPAKLAALMSANFPASAPRAAES